MKYCFAAFFFLASVSYADITASTEKPVLDLTLDKTIELALSNSLVVKQSQALLDAATADTGVAKSNFFPVLSAGLLAGTYHDRLSQPGDTSVPVTARDRNNYVAQLKASQSLFAGFRDSSNLAASNGQKKVAEKNLEIAKYDIVEQVIQLYFGAQLDIRNLAAEKEVQALRAQQLKEVQSKLHQGSATILDQLQAEYALKAQDPQITTIEADLDSKKIKLARIIGVPLDQAFLLKSEFTNAIVDSVISKLPAFPVALEYALRTNPHFGKYEAQLSVLQAQSGQSMSKHLPTLDLNLNAGTNAYARYDIATNDSLTYSAEVVLTVPLFSGLSSFSERAEWQAKLDALKQERANFRENFLDQLNDAYRKLQVASSKLEAETVNVKLADMTVLKARGFYGLGRASLSDVLNSYSHALDAKKSLAQSMYDRVFALYHIKTALGAGLANFEAAPATH